jgi:hypothetical protein
MSQPSNLPRTLEEILKDYSQADKLSKQNPEAFPLNGRPGIEMRIRQSKDKLPKLRLEYLTKILKSSYGFFLEGLDDAKKVAFAKIAVDNGAVTVDADAIYQKIADVVQPTMGRTREFSVTQVSLMDHTLKEVVEKTGYDGTLNRTVIGDMRVCKDRPRLVAYIRDLVARSNGSTPATVAAQSEIVSQALAREFSGKRLVVVVTNASAGNRAAIGGLFTKNTTVDVDAIEEVNEETAATIFREGLGLTKTAA